MAKHAAYGLSIPDLDVVIIDDNESMLAILRTIFNAFDVNRLRAFSEPRRALKSVFESPPNLIVTDWRMGPVDGLSLIRRLRHERGEPACFAAIMVVSGDASIDHVSAAFRAGANQFLVKPVSPAAVLDRIRWICRDERDLVLEDNHYVIDGVKEALASRRRVAEATNAGQAKSEGRRVIVDT